MFKNTYIALDITNSDIRILAVKGNKIIRWSTAPIPEDAIKDGIIVEPHTLSVIIDNLFKTLNLKKNRVICSITGLPFIYRVISMPHSTRAVTDEAVERAARKEMSLTQEDIYLVWQATQATASKDELDYFVLGVPKHAISPLIETLDAADIKPYIVDLKPLALARAASRSDALILSLERGYFDIVIVADGLVRVMHSVNPGSRTSDIMGNVNELVDGLNKAIKSFNRDFPQNSLKTDTPILVSGEVAADESLRKILQEATGHEVSILTPLANLPPEAPALMFSTCVGLVTKKIPKFIDKSAYHDIDVNVLIRTRKQSQLKYKLAYAGVGLLFLLLAGVVYKSYDLKIGAADRTEALRKESTRVTQLLSNAQKSYSQAQTTKKELEDKIQSLTNELNIISGEHQYIKNLQYDYARSINLVNVSLPAGAYYEEIGMKPGAITVKGEALDKYDVLTFTEAMERTTVFSSARIESLEPIGEDNPGVKFTTIVNK